MTGRTKKERMMRELDLSAGGFPELVYVGKDTTVADVVRELAALRADAERMKAELNGLKIAYEREAARFDAIQDDYTHKLQQELASALNELAALRADAARGRWMLGNAEWWCDTIEKRTHLTVLVPYGADLSCYATREAAIDAAMKERG